MTESFVLSFAQNALQTAVLLAAPFLVASLVIGILVSLIQAVTQINEMTLTFVPKMIGMIVILLVLGSWLLQKILAYTTDIFANLASLPF